MVPLETGIHLLPRQDLGFLLFVLLVLWPFGPRAGPRLPQHLSRVWGSWKWISQELQSFLLKATKSAQREHRNQCAGLVK